MVKLRQNKADEPTRREQRPPLENLGTWYSPEPTPSIGLLPLENRLKKLKKKLLP